MDEKIGVDTKNKFCLFCLGFSVVKSMKAENVVKC